MNRQRMVSRLKSYPGALPSFLQIDVRLEAQCLRVPWQAVAEPAKVRPFTVGRIRLEHLDIASKIRLAQRNPYAPDKLGLCFSDRDWQAHPHKEVLVVNDTSI